MADIFSSIVNGLSTGLIGYIVPFLFVLTLVVFIHELGHFLVARWCGIKVLTFSVGFGPELCGFNDRHGTRWKLSAIPLGGYVKFFGDDSEASTPNAGALQSMSEADRKVAFHHKPVAARAAVVVAGPVANFLLAIGIFAVLFMLYGYPNQNARVDAVQPGSVAEQAGFRAGDIVTAINGRRVETFGDMQRIVSLNAENPLEFAVTRDGATIRIAATPALREVKDRLGNTQRIGQLGIQRNNSAAEVKGEPVSFPYALVLGAKQSWTIVETTFDFLGGVIMRQAGVDQIGGPIRIAQLSGQAARVGFDFLIHITAVLSVSIGLLNLFPVPLLDGGHLVFYAIEAIRGRPLSERAQEMGFRVGLALVLMLMIFATYNDILHLTRS